MGILSPSHMRERGLPFQLESVSAVAVLAHAGREISHGIQSLLTVYISSSRTRGHGEKLRSVVAAEMLYVLAHAGRERSREVQSLPMILGLVPGVRGQGEKCGSCALVAAFWRTMGCAMRQKSDCACIFSRIAAVAFALQVSVRSTIAATSDMHVRLSAGSGFCAQHNSLWHWRTALCAQSSCGFRIQRLDGREARRMRVGREVDPVTMACGGNPIPEARLAAGEQRAERAGDHAAVADDQPVPAAPRQRLDAARHAREHLPVALAAGDDECPDASASQRWYAGVSLSSS